MTNYDGPAYLKKQKSGQLSSQPKKQSSLRHASNKERSKLFTPAFIQKEQSIHLTSEQKRVFEQRLHERQQSHLLSNQERLAHYSPSYDYQKKYIEDDLMDSSTLLEGEHVDRQQYDVPFHQRQHHVHKSSDNTTNRRVVETVNDEKNETFTPTFIPSSEYVTGRVMPSRTQKAQEDDNATTKVDTNMRALSKKLTKDKDSYLLFEQGNQDNDRN